MGRLGIEAMLQHTDASTALYWHLTANHYPPHPTFMIPVAQLAIDKVNAGETDFEIELPAQVKWRGQSTVRASAVIESMHLDMFLQDQES